MSRVRDLLSPAALVFTVVTLATVLVSAPREAQALTTAANTTIRNTVTVSYKNLADTVMTPITATVDITVTLVAATPTLVVEANKTTTPSVAAGYGCTLTSNANGPDSYALTKAALTLSGGIGVSADAFSATPILLGATTVATAGSISDTVNTVISVPSDLVADSSVNGIVATDKVVINGQLFTVASVVDNGGVDPPTLSTITVIFNGTTTAIAAGDLVGEQQSFNYTVTPGTVSGVVNQTIDSIISAKSATAPKTADFTRTTTVTVPQLTVTKYVANTVTWAAGTGTPINLNVSGSAHDYYPASVTGKPGEILEYVVRISNAAGGSQATNVIIEDPLNMFVTYLTTSIRIGADDNSFSAVLIDGKVEGDAAWYDGALKKIYIYAGAGGNAQTGVGGTLDANKKTYGAYRVTIN